VARVLVDGKASGAITINVYPLFGSTGGIGIGRYPTSPIQHQHRDKGYFEYTGEIDRVEYDLERPVEDMDLMLELEIELERA
jgi:hypothetical protein